MKKLFLIAALLVLLFGCTKEEKLKEYEYVVTCTSDTCQIMYADKYNNMQNVWCMTTNNWSYKFTTQNEERLLFLYAKNSCNYGDITIVILCDGDVIGYKTASGGYCEAELNQEN
jgi:hypothetical protein